MRAWEHRRDGEDTPAYLGRVLEDYLGFPAMAQRARDGAFTARLADVDGYPLIIGDGIGRLANELAGKLAVVHKTDRSRIHAVEHAVAAGEFDGTVDEHRAWAATEAGQAAIGGALRAHLGIAT